MRRPTVADLALSFSGDESLLRAMNAGEFGVGKVRLSRDYF